MQQVSYLQTEKKKKLLKKKKLAYINYILKKCTTIINTYLHLFIFAKFCYYFNINLQRAIFLIFNAQPLEPLFSTTKKTEEHKNVEKN